MNTRTALPAAILLTAALLLMAVGCGPADAPDQAATKAPAVRTLTLAAYTTPREVYGREIIPAFQKMWKEKTGQEVRFEESYLGSGAQARAVVGGFEADVAALSLEPDLQTLVEAGLVRPDWNRGPHGGMVSRFVGDVNVLDASAHRGEGHAGALRIPLPDVADGQERLVIRTYDLHFRRSGDGPGTVRRVVHLGDKVKVGAQVDGAGLLCAQLSRYDEALRELEPGARVAVDVAHARSYPVAPA